jgi:hypothetical protein
VIVTCRGFSLPNSVAWRETFLFTGRKMAALSLIECGLWIQNKAVAAHPGAASNLGRKTRL